MNYTLNQLQIFLKIAQLQSITKAAEELHITQPAVSIQLRNFQDQFGLALTEQIGRRIYITDFGKEVAIAAEKILDEVYALNYKTQEHNGQLTGRLKISIVSTGKYIMPYFLSGFLDKNPGVELIMDVTNKAEVIKNLEKNEVDLSFVSTLPEKPLVEKITLMQNKLYLVGSGKIVSPSKKKNLAILEGQKMIYREEGSATKIAMEQFIKTQELPLQKKLELTGNEAVKQAIIAGLGISIMPLIGIKNELNNGALKIIPLKGLPIITTWNIVWLSGKKFSNTASAFINYINTNKELIMREHFDWYEKF